MVKLRVRTCAQNKGRSQEQSSNGQVMVKLSERPRAQRKGMSPEQSKNGQTPSETHAQRKGRSPEQPARESAARDSWPWRELTRNARQSRKQTHPQTPHVRSASDATKASASHSRPWRRSQQRLASLTPRLNSHDGRLSNAAASGPE